MPKLYVLMLTAKQYVRLILCYYNGGSADGNVMKNYDAGAAYDIFIAAYSASELM